MLDFPLQQLGVESIVERGQFCLDGSRTTSMQGVGDVFTFNGHTFAEKQPGQFMLGSVVYFPLHLFGLRYVDNYILTSALVTFFSVSVIAALGTLALFSLSRMILATLGLDAKRIVRMALAVALLYAFATTQFVYAVLPHHDVLAASYLIVAFWLSYRARHADSHNTTTTFFSALLLGLTVTTSMLALWPGLVVGIYLIASRPIRVGAIATIGVFVGLLPLFYYDLVSFGNILLLANIAANASDTFLKPTPSFYVYKFWLFVKWLLLYCPIVLAAIVGVVRLPRALRAEKLTITAAILLLFVYLLNIDTMGGWQYGPRYLIPIVPFSMLGMIGIYANATKRLQGALVVIGMYSVLVSLLGVIGGAMYDNMPHFAALTYLQQVADGTLTSFPLLPVLIAPALIAGSLLLHERASA